MTKLRYRILYTTGHKRGLEAVVTIEVPFNELSGHVALLEEDILFENVLKDGNSQYVVKGIVYD